MQFTRRAAVAGVSCLGILPLTAFSAKSAPRTATVIPCDDPKNFKFRRYGNELWGFKYRGTPGSRLELHVVNLSEPGRFILQTSTAMPIEPSADYDFHIRNSYVYAIQKSKTQSNRTELHILNRDNYQSFLDHFATGLHTTDSSFEFGFNRNNDLVAVKKRGTGTSRTEVHVLTGSSRYAQFGLQVPTYFPELGEDWRVSIGASAALIAYHVANTASGTSERTVVRPVSGADYFASRKPGFFKPRVTGFPIMDLNWDVDCEEFRYVEGGAEKLGYRTAAVCKAGTSSGQMEVVHGTGDA